MATRVGQTSACSQIASAVSAGDSALVASLAHRLKGAAANLSAEPLREAATELEALGHGAQLPLEARGERER